MAEHIRDIELNPENPRHLQKLREAIRESREALRPFREHRREAVEHYVGGHYGDHPAAQDVPVNYLELMVNTFVPLLAAKAPQVLATTTVKELRSFAKTLEQRMNDYIRVDLDLEPVLRRWVVDAMFPGFGVLKMALKQRGAVEESPGRFLPVGVPFVMRVDQDDWVHDMTARHWDEVQFMGDRYRPSYAWVVENPDFDPAARRLLSPDIDPRYNEDGVERIETLSHSRGIVDVDTYRQKIELWDIWMPREGYIVTVADKHEIPALKIRKWTGPTNGPYHRLLFSEVPNQIMPLSPTSVVLDLHILFNDLFNKLAAQAERQKTIGIVNPAGADDADRIVKAADGEFIKSQNPAATKEMSFRGPDQTTFAFMLQTKALLNTFGGNVELLSGASPQSDTLGQDRMLMANASQRVQDMQNSVIRATTRLVRDLAFYLWHDPLEESRVFKQLPGTPFGVDATFAPETLKGKFLDYKISIEPYSMQHVTPGEKLNRLTQLFQTYMVPLLPLAQSQGYGPDMRKLFKIVAKLSNMEPELDDIFQFLNTNTGDSGSGGPPPSPPSSSARPSPSPRPSTATPNGRDAALINRLIGGSLQPSEAKQEFAA